MLEVTVYGGTSKLCTQILVYFDVLKHSIQLADEV